MGETFGYPVNLFFFFFNKSQHQALVAFQFFSSPLGNALVKKQRILQRALPWHGKGSVFLHSWPEHMEVERTASPFFSEVRVCTWAENAWDAAPQPKGLAQLVWRTNSNPSTWIVISYLQEPWKEMVQWDGKASLFIPSELWTAVKYSIRIYQILCLWWMLSPLEVWWLSFEFLAPTGNVWVFLQGSVIPIHPTVKYLKIRNAFLNAARSNTRQIYPLELLSVETFSS